LLTPPRNDTSSSALTRGRRCGTAGSHLSMMSGGEVLVTSSIDENSEFVETDAENVLNDIVVSHFTVLLLHVILPLRPARQHLSCDGYTVVQLTDSRSEFLRHLMTYLFKLAFHC